MAIETQVTIRCDAGREKMTVRREGPGSIGFHFMDACGIWHDIFVSLQDAKEFAAYIDKLAAEDF